MHIIVGIDPGKTSGIACIDLNGKLLFKTHRIFAGADWLVSAISAVGTPVIIASDKPTVSAIVKKINSSFSARLFYPERVLSIDEKLMLATKESIKNPHERDAYAAAIKAYNAYANKLKQAEHLAAENKIEDVDEIKAKVIDKYSISEALQNRKANRR